MTKKESPMAFLKITDKTGSMEIVTFPKTYEQFKDLLQTDQCIAIKGKVSNRNGVVSVLADMVKKIG